MVPVYSLYCCLVCYQEILFGQLDMGICCLITLVFVSAPSHSGSIKRAHQTCKHQKISLYSAGLSFAFPHNLIDSLPKFAMEGAFLQHNQLCFSIFPAHTILMISTLIYRPQLFKLASLLETSIHNPLKRFVMVLTMFGAIAVVTIGTAAFVEFIGILS